MPFVQQCQGAVSPYRRTLRGGTVYSFEPGKVAEIPAGDLRELLERSPGVLEEVKAERRGGEIRRWRPVKKDPEPEGKIRRKKSRTKALQE